MLLVGCVARSENEVVIYTAHDSVFSEPILEQFAEETGIAVRPKFDFESTKTVGLTTAIMAEAGRPVCDVFWNNEILNTLRLKRQGLLQVYRPAVADSYPAAFKDADGMWHGFAARARILIVNTDLMAAADRPTSLYHLGDPKFKGKVGIAKPLFGTTATHAACLFSVLGDDKAEEFFLQLKDNDIQILSGNKQVAIDVAQGRLLFGLTDTDDALAMIDQAYPVAIIYPDRQSDQLGTLFIPNTLAIIKGCGHEKQARQLVDYLLSPGVETRLAEGPAGQIPLNPSVRTKARVETPTTVKAMEVDFAAAAEKWDAAAQFIARNFADE
jgi:iron(III) transport system substrate-binding protein